MYLHVTMTDVERLAPQDAEIRLSALFRTPVTVSFISMIGTREMMSFGESAPTHLEWVYDFHVEVSEGTDDNGS